MASFLEELQIVEGEIMQALADGSRLSTDELAKRLERDEELVKTVVQSMYVERKVRPLYVYEKV